MAARIRTIRIKPVTPALQTRGFLGQQLLLPVQLVQIVLSAHGHEGFLSTTSRTGLLYTLTGLLHAGSKPARYHARVNDAFERRNLPIGRDEKRSWHVPDPGRIDARALEFIDLGSCGPAFHAMESRVFDCSLDRIHGSLVRLDQYEIHVRMRFPHLAPLRQLHKTRPTGQTPDVNHQGLVGMGGPDLREAVPVERADGAGIRRRGRLGEEDACGEEPERMRDATHIASN